MQKEPVSLQELLWRATSGRVPDTSTMLAASMMYFINTDPFWLWCELNAPQAEAAVEESEYDRRVLRLGSEFEARWILQNYPQAQRPRPERGHEALVDTIRLMKEGVRAIYQPVLLSVSDELHGRGDLLVRVDDAPSDLGAFSYKVVEVKRSTAPSKPHHRLQAAVYSKILGTLQGRVLDFDIALPSGVERVEFERVKGSLQSAIAAWKQMKSGGVMPLPRGPGETKSPWRVYADRLLTSWLDTTMLPDVGPSGRERVRHRLGVASIPEIARFNLKDLIAAMGERRGTSLFHHAQARLLNRPIVPSGAPIVLPRGSRTFDYDIETSDENAPLIAQPPHTFLCGLLNHEKNEYVCFEARGPKEEEGMYRRMLEYIGNMEGVVVRIWSSYEIGQTLKAQDRYPSLRVGLNAFMDRFVDLKEAVKRAVCLPVSSYSLKEVAPALGFSWPDAGFGAFDLMTGYWKMLETGDTGDWEKGLRYLEADVRAMKHVDDVLSNLSPSG